MEHRWKVLAVTSIGLFMASLDLFIVNIAFPDLSRSFGNASLSSLSWVLNGYAIIFAALLVPAGRIADRVGRKRVFITGLLTFSAASALCALAPTIPFLVGARVLQAAGAAMMIPTTLGLLLPAFPVEQRPLAIGIWSAVSGVAAALGPPIGGILVQLSWHWIFLVNVPIGLLTAFAAVRILDEAHEPEDGRPDLLGAAMLALGIGLLTLGIVQGPEWGWSDGRVLGSFVAAIALVAAFLYRSAHHRAPVIELPLLRVRSFALANLATLVFFMGFGAMLLSGVLLLTEVWGWSELRAGFALSPGPLMAAIFAAPSGKLGARIGQRPVATLGGLVFAGGFAFMLADDRSQARIRHHLPARVHARRHRRRPHPGDAPRRGHRLAPPGTLRHRLGGLRHGPPARLGDRRRRPRRPSRLRRRRPPPRPPQRLVVRPRLRPRRRRPRVLPAGAGEGGGRRGSAGDRVGR